MATVDIMTALQRYLRHHRVEKSSPHTIDAHQRWARQFAEYLAGQHHSLDIEDLRADDLRGWVDELRAIGSPSNVPGRARIPNSDHSVRSKVIHIKAFVRWLVAEDYLPRDPFARVAVPKADDLAKPTLTPEDIETILRSCNPRTVTGRRDAAIVLLLYSTALRVAELRAIKVEDVDHDQAQITVRRGKGGKFRIVPLSPKVERSLDRYLNHPTRRKQPQGGFLFLTQQGGPLTRTGAKMIFERLAAKSGIPCNAHKWRHSSAVQYLRQGGRLELLQKLLGHTTLQMSLHYARMAGVDVKAAHESADPTNGIKYRP